MEWEVVGMVSLMIACIYLIRQLWMAEAKATSSYDDGFVAGWHSAERAAELLSGDGEHKAVMEFVLKAVTEQIKADKLYKRGDLKELRGCETRNELERVINRIIRRRK